MENGLQTAESQSPPPPVPSELERWRRLGASLWPAIRMWPLAGCGTNELECVTELAALLKVECPHVTADQMRIVRRETMFELAAWVEESGWLRRMSPDARLPFISAIKERIIQ